MSTTLSFDANRTPASPAQRLRANMAAVRVAFTWFGVRKTLTPQQKAQAADAFGAEGEFLSAGKKLLNTSHAAFKAVTSVRNRILSYWRSISLPYPEPGVRLIRQDDLAGFDVQLGTFKADLVEAVSQLDEHYATLQAQAREQLGSLYNAGDYPPSLEALFEVTWDYPSVDPPEYLRQLSPQLFAEESRRIAARFDEAVELAEQAFLAELSKLVSHLTERLSGTEDGKPKIFRDSAVENLREFFERFRHLSIHSNEQLDELVAQADQIVRGIDPQELRDQASLRRQLARRLSGVQSVLDGMMVDRPRRNILRRPR